MDNFMDNPEVGAALRPLAERSWEELQVYLKNQVAEKKSLLKERHFWAKFWSRVQVNTRKECWEWWGSYHGDYGTLNKQFAHRLSYEHLVGAIPEGYVVHHTCENPACCNPDHLKAMSKDDHKELHEKLQEESDETL